MDDRTISLALFSDLQTRKLTNRDGSQYTLQPVTVGDTLLCTLTVQNRIDSELREVDLPVRSLAASIGRIHEPPTAGTFTLKTPAPVVPASLTLTQDENARFLDSVSVHLPGEAGSPLWDFDVTENADLAAGAAQLADAPDLSDWLTVTSADGTVILTAKNPAHCVSVIVGAYAPDDLELDWQPIQLTGNPSEPAEPFVNCAPISFDADAEAVRTPLAALPRLAQINVAKETEGCWLAWLANGDDFTLAEGTTNRLEPASFVRLRKYQRFGSEWVYEIRLLQQPIAVNEAGFERVLAPAPSIERVMSGDPGNDSTPPTNEIQALKIDPEFRGTYVLNWNGYRSRILGIEDGPDQIAEALNAMFSGSTAARFEVTVAEANKANIEFVGLLGGEPQALITVTIVTFSPGVLTFALPLTRAEAHNALRLVKEVEMPFEVSVELGDPDAPETPGRELTLFQTNIKIGRELNFAGQAAVAKIDWQNPRPPVDYIPFTRDQIITGSQHYVATFGNGVARTFEFPHNLGTSAFTFLVRENHHGGNALVLGTDYTASFPNDNALSLALLPSRPTPNAGALAIVITSAGPKSAFQAHTHTIEQVLDLAEKLAELFGRVENLEDLLPTTSVARREQRTEPTEVEFPDFIDLFPGRFEEGFDVASLAESSKAAPKLPRPGALLPAIHDATMEPLPLPLPIASGSSTQFEASGYFTAQPITPGGDTVQLSAPPDPSKIQAGSIVRFGTSPTHHTVLNVAGNTLKVSPAFTNLQSTGAGVLVQTVTPYAGRVFRNESGAAVTVPGAAGRRSASVEASGYVGNDGRFWYRLTKHGSTNSYFPTDFERELVLFHVNPEMWQPGERIQLTFELSAQTFAASSNVQCVVVIEAGTAPQETTPAPVGPNLERIEWASKPILETRLLLSGARMKHKFGALIKRPTSGDTFEGERLNYTAWTQAPAESMPTEPGIVLRARVIAFDTENNAKTATGFVFLHMTEARATIA